MTVAHVFYIPVVVLAGLVLGFVLGRRSALAEFEARSRKAEAREAARERRRARRRSGHES